MNAALPFVTLVDHVTDPMIRSSFYASLARNQAFAACHLDAMSSLEFAADEVKRASLDFAARQIRISRASSLIGLARYGAARRELLTVEEGPPLDDYDAANLALQEGRLHIVCGRPDMAEKLLSHITQAPDAATEAELLAYRALAMALLGESSTNQLAVEARLLTPTIEANVVSRFAEAVLAVRAGRPEPIAVATATSERTGLRDAALLVFRADPALRDSVRELSDPASRSLFTAVTVAEEDAASQRRRTKLSSREQEVYELLLTGLSNRDIGSALFISQVTVKAHLRHIFEKLGVRSRAQAILAAKYTN